MRALLFAIAALVATPAAAQGLFVAPLPPVDQTARDAATAAQATASAAQTSAAAASSVIYTGKGNKLVQGTTSETSILPAVGSGGLSVPGSKSASGNVILVDGAGSYRARTLTPGTLTFNIKINGVTVGNVVLANLVAGVTGGCDFRAAIVIGDGGALTVMGGVGYVVSATAKYPGTIATVGTPSVTLGSGFTIDVTAQWGTADNDNWVRGEYASIRVMRAN